MYEKCGMDSWLGHWLSLCLWYQSVPSNYIKLGRDRPSFTKSQIHSLPPRPWTLVRVTERIHYVICLPTDPQPLPKRLPHRVQSGASNFNLQYPICSSWSFSIWLRFLPRLPATLFIPSFFPSITYFRRQFRRNMWRIQLAFLLYIAGSIFLSSLTLLHFSHDRSTRASQSFCSTIQHFPGQ